MPEPKQQANPPQIPTPDDIVNRPEEEKNLDRDAHEKQPTDQSESK